MGIDLNAVKKRLTNLQNQNSKKTALWKPEPGDNLIRIVPYKYAPENPFIELMFHYEVGNKTMLSPTTFGRPDPIQEFADQLKSTGEKEDWQLARKIEPKMRTYVPVLVRGKESEGVRFWGFGKQVYEQLLSVIADPDYGDITDPVKGRDITVTFTPGAGENFAKTKLLVKPNQTPASTDKAIIAKIKDQSDLTADVFEEVDYDSLKKELEAWLSPSEDSEETPATGGKLPFDVDDTPGTPVVVSDEVSSEFNALFEDDK
jgi:hypothetical protein